MLRRSTSDEYPLSDIRAREAVANAREFQRSGTTEFYRMCLGFVRRCWELDAAPYGDPTAYKEWLRTPRGSRHLWTGDPDDIPYGAPVFSQRRNAPSNDPGHVFITGGHDRNGHRIFRSNDIVVAGGISVVHITDFETKWNHVILGWTDTLYETRLQLPPSPNKRERDNR